MKLASYVSADDGRVRAALVVSDEEMIDLEAAMHAVGGSPRQAAVDIHELIEGGARLWEVARRAASDPQGRRLQIAQVQLAPAVQRPSKICCLALNNSSNVDRIVKGPKHPAFFTKPSTALVGHGGAIRIKPHYGRVHPEPELAVVIGRTATDIEPDAAWDHVFGYTAHNDLTSPTMRDEDSFHYRAIHPAAEGEGIRYVESNVSYPGRYKGSDTFSAMGPWIVTKDEIPDPHGLVIECRVRDELYTRDHTSNLVHKVPQVLSFLSRYTTLVPGDIVSMGTALAAAGVPGRAVQNADLSRLEGPVSVTIERIGTLSNPVVRTTTTSR